MLIKVADLVENPDLKKEVERSFWGMVYKREDCWFWCGAMSNTGYGKFEHKAWKRAILVISAHRLGYFLQHGADPGNLEVCYRCDNKRCVRGDHLFLGTHAENMRDYSEKYQAKKKAGETK